MRLAQVIYYFSFLIEVSKERCTRCNVGRPRVITRQSACVPDNHPRLNLVPMQNSELLNNSNNELEYR
jgi:hypothetical protein